MPDVGQIRANMYRLVRTRTGTGTWGGHSCTWRLADRAGTLVVSPQGCGALTLTARHLKTMLEAARRRITTPAARPSSANRR